MRFAVLFGVLASVTGINAQADAYQQCKYPRSFFVEICLCWQAVEQDGLEQLPVCQGSIVVLETNVSNTLMLDDRYTNTS